MTHQENYNLSSSAVEELTRNGLEAIPELVRVILNSAMQAERSNYLQANAYERTEERKGHAKGGFYPSASMKCTGTAISEACVIEVCMV